MRICLLTACTARSSIVAFDLHSELRRSLAIEFKRFACIASIADPEGVIDEH